MDKKDDSQQQKTSKKPEESSKTKSTTFKSGVLKKGLGGVILTGVRPNK